MPLLIPRRKLLLGAVAGICAPYIARAQVPMTGAGKGAPGGGGGGGGASVDAVGTKLLQTAATSSNYTGITVGSGTNRALVVSLAFDTSDASAGPSGLSLVWDSGGTNQSMTLIVGGLLFDPNGAGCFLYGLVAPTSGNKTLAISWTNSNRVFINAISFTGVNQTGGTTTFPNSAISAAANATMAVSSATGNIVVSVEINTSSFTTLTGTTIYSDSASGSNVAAASNYDVGAATVNIGVAAGANPRQQAVTDVKSV